MYSMVFLSICFMRKWGINALHLWWREVYLFNKETNDRVEAPWLTLSPCSTVTASFPLQLYLRFVSVFTKITFVVDFFFLSSSEEQTAGAETEDPQRRSFGKCRWKEEAGVQDLVGLRSACFLAAQPSHVWCLCLLLDVYPRHVTVQLQFSSHFATRREGEGMGRTPII